MRICLTPEEFEKIKSELDTRINQKRKEIAVRLNVAKELGDLSENTEYTSAKEEQGFNEARIKELENLIRSAEVVKKNHNGKVCIGNQVKLKSDTGIHKFSVVGPEGIDLTNGKISYESPLGQALMYKKVGNVIKVETPKGKIEYKIIEIK